MLPPQATVVSVQKILRHKRHQNHLFDVTAELTSKGLGCLQTTFPTSCSGDEVMDNRVAVKGFRELADALDYEFAASSRNVSSGTTRLTRPS